MAIRICPVCSGVVPAGSAVAYSDGLDCPHCKARLEVSSFSRMLPSAAGLAAGWLVWQITKNMSGTLDWALPVLYAILAFGMVTPLALMFTAKLRPAPVPPPVAATPPAGHSHH